MKWCLMCPRTGTRMSRVPSGLIPSSFNSPERKSHGKRGVAGASAPRNLHLDSACRWASLGSRCRPPAQDVCSHSAHCLSWPPLSPLPSARRHFWLRFRLIWALLGFRPRWSLPKGATASSISRSCSHLLGQWRSRTLCRDQPARGGGLEPGLDQSGGPWRKRPETLSTPTKRARCGCRRHGPIPSRPGTRAPAGPVGPGAGGRCLPLGGPWSPSVNPDGQSSRVFEGADLLARDPGGAPSSCIVPDAASIVGTFSARVPHPLTPRLGTRFCPSFAAWWKGPGDSKLSVLSWEEGFQLQRIPPHTPHSLLYQFWNVFSRWRGFWRVLTQKDCQKKVR